MLLSSDCSAYQPSQMSPSHCLFSDLSVLVWLSFLHFLPIHPSVISYSSLSTFPNVYSSTSVHPPTSFHLFFQRNRPGDVAFRDCAELEEYAESTNAPIHYALAEAFGMSPSPFVPNSHAPPLNSVDRSLILSHLR